MQHWIIHEHIVERDLEHDESSDNDAHISMSSY